MTSLEIEQLKKTMVEAEKTGQTLVDSFSSSTSSSTSGISSGSSLESDSFEEVTSLCSSSSSSDQLSADPLSDMSSLFLQLPIKRGLSRHYQGKSQSFISLTNVRSVEDLAKPENPLNKRLKSCRSYGVGLGETQKVKSSPNAFSRHMSRKGLHSSSRGSCSTLGAKRGISRAPIPPYRSTTISTTTTTTIATHTALFA